MISHIFRQFVVFSIAAGMLVQPLSVAAQYAYPMVSSTPAPTPSFTPTPWPTSSAAPTAPAETFPALDPDPTLLAFRGGMGDKAIDFVPKFDLSNPKDKEQYDRYKSILEKAISQVMNDTDLIKIYEKVNLIFRIVPDLKAHLLANAKEYGLPADLIAKLKDKDFTIDSFLLLMKAPDGTVTYVLLIDANLFKNFAAVIVAINTELQRIVLIEAGTKFPTDMDEEIAVIGATIKSLEKVLAGMEKIVGPDHPAVKGLKALIETQKAKLAELKKKAAAASPVPKPSPICTPMPSMSPSPSPC